MVFNLVAKLLICYWKTENKFLMLYNDTNVSNVPIKYIIVKNPIPEPDLALAFKQKWNEFLSISTTLLMLVN